MSLRYWLLLIMAAAATELQGIDYPIVQEGAGLHFPRDHGSHPQYRMEWWYVTGWLKDKAGEEFGFQITFFRNRPGVQEDNPVPLAPKQLVFAHVAIASARWGKLLHDQRAARVLAGVVSANETTMDVHVQDWRLAREGPRIVTSGKAKEFAWQMSLEPTQPLMLHGEAGFSRKGSHRNQASYYYSQPHIAVSGNLTIHGEQKRVSGAAWLDHEWFSALLPADAVGWDWTGINFDDGRALMAFRIRDSAGSALWAGGTLRDSHGHLHALLPDEIAFTPGRRWRSPRTQAEYPVEWRVKVPGLTVSLTPMMDDQELDGRASHGAIYWEGAVRAGESGRVSGLGYLELTGYAAPLKF